MTVTFVLNTGYSLFHPQVRETYGGAQIDLYLLGRELSADAQFQISFIFLDYGQPMAERANNIQLYKSYQPRNKQNLLWQFIRAVYRLWHVLHRTNADIYMHEGPNFEVGVTALYCALRRRRLVFRVSSVIDIDGRYLSKNPLQGRIYAWGLRHASMVISQTREQQEILQRQGIKSLVIRNGYPLSNEAASPEGHVLWIGRLIKIKRPELFIQLARLYPNKSFVMIAQEETIDRDFSASIIEAIKSTKNLQYFPKVDYHRIDQYFKRASLLINTSSYEGFPLTFVQAMSFGLPIVTLGIDPDGVISTIAGKVANSFAELVELIKFFDDPQHWSVVSERARNHMRLHHNLQAITMEYKKIFSDLQRQIA